MAPTSSPRSVPPTTCTSATRAEGAATMVMPRIARASHRIAAVRWSGELGVVR